MSSFFKITLMEFCRILNRWYWWIALILTGLLFSFENLSKYETISIFKMENYHLFLLEKVWSGPSIHGTLIEILFWNLPLIIFLLLEEESLSPFRRSWRYHILSRSTNRFLMWESYTLSLYMACFIGAMILVLMSIFFDGCLNGYLSILNSIENVSEIISLWGYFIKISIVLINVINIRILIDSITYNFNISAFPLSILFIIIIVFFETNHINIPFYLPFINYHYIFTSYYNQKIGKYTEFLINCLTYMILANFSILLIKRKQII